MGEVRALKRSYVITRSQRAIRVEAIATFAISESLPTMTLRGVRISRVIDFLARD
jgi:hypothetical protein